MKIKRFTFALIIFYLIIFVQTSLFGQEDSPLRRPISPEQPMWLIHIDTWNYADPQKIIDLVPEDIRPFVVMNISISINHDAATSKWKTCEYAYETAKSWVRTCAENQMWVMVQQSSGGYQHFSETDLTVYEEFYRDYPNFIGFNYAEQFWGFDDWNDALSPAWTDRMSLFANLLELSNRYGGYLSVSWCGNQWGPSINPIGMMKRNPYFAAACAKYTENYILSEKYTQQSYQSDMESLCLGAYLSGYSGQYGCRYDDTGWTDANGTHNNFTMATAGAVHLEHMMLTGQTVIDGPELIWTQCFRETNGVATTEGYTMRNWETYPQFDNVSVDIFRKILDGTVRIPSRQEVIDRTKFVVVNDVNTGNDDAKYSIPETLTQGLYRMDGDGNLRDNKTFFKKTGRYPTIPVVYLLDDSLANSFQNIVNKSAYSSRWPSIASKQAEFNNLFPQEYTGDLYVGRNENAWVTYNPYKTVKTANASIPFLYNTCDSMELSYSQYTAGVVKEYSDQLTFYLSNYDNVINTGLKTDVIQIYGSSSEPTYSYAERGNHQASKVSNTWSDGIFTLTIQHNGPLDITVNCSGTATDRLTSFKVADIKAPKKPAIYKGAHQYEAENFDYKNINRNYTNGVNSGVGNYTAQGFLDFGNKSSASIRDTVTVLEAGIYELGIKYAASGEDVNSIDLFVNGTKINTPSFLKTVSKSDWAIYTQRIELNEGKNVLALTASKAGANIIFDHIIVGPEARYDFTNDLVSTSAATPPADYINLQSGSAGVVTYTDANSLTSNVFKSYSVGLLNSTGVADLDRFPVASNYSVSWKEYYSTTAAEKGILLRANGENGSCAYADGMKQGYLFTVINNADQTVTLKSYLATSSGIEEKASYTSTFTIDVDQPCWYRATATDNELMFECSNDSMNWEGSHTTTFYDESYSYGSTELVWGLNSGNFDWVMDDITYVTTQLLVSAETFSGMSYLIDAGPSSSQEVKISGRSLMAGIDLTVSDNFEIALNPDSTYSSVLSIALNGGAIDTIIFVRLKSGFESGVYSGDLILTTKGAAKQTIALNGSVITDLIYNFANDVPGAGEATPPAFNITIGESNGAAAGVVSYKYSDETSNCFRAYNGGERNGTGVANLTLFPADSANYSVTWKQAIGTKGKDYKVGVLLRGSQMPEGGAGYVNGIMQGYVFIVYNAGGATTPHSEFRIYKSSEATNLNMLVNNSVNTLVPLARQPMWYRASANGIESTELILEYSSDNLNWFVGATFTDQTTTYPNGKTQLIWGLAAGNWDFYLDDIGYNSYHPNTAISVSQNKMTGFYYSKGNGPSDHQSFNILGNQMSTQLEIMATENFEISFNSSTNYESTLVLSGAVEKMVYVRLKEGLAVGKYEGEIAITSSEADKRLITLNGYVRTSTGVNHLGETNATLVSTEYFSLTGQKVIYTNHLKGIYIVKKLMSDNSIKVSKVCFTF
ncbi:MAG: glycoside hydrolase family 98 domain-containing protein [Prolixibacteraceae bacterium]